MISFINKYVRPTPIASVNEYILIPEDMLWMFTKEFYEGELLVEQISPVYLGEADYVLPYNVLSNPRLTNEEKATLLGYAGAINTAPIFEWADNVFVGTPGGSADESQLTADQKDRLSEIIAGSRPGRLFVKQRASTILRGGS